VTDRRELAPLVGQAVALFGVVPFAQLAARDVGLVLMDTARRHFATSFDRSHAWYAAWSTRGSKPLSSCASAWAFVSVIEPR
jgi:hypothetical protein